MEAPDRQRVGVALFLSVALAVAASVMDFGKPAFEHLAEVTLYGFEDAIESEEGPARSVSHGEPFMVESPCAIEVELTRERPVGWSGVLVGLVPQGDSDVDVRDVPLELLDGEQVAHAHFSAVAAATYRLRIEGAVDGPAESEQVQVRITGGRRTPWPLLLAGLLVWAPALFALARRSVIARAHPERNGT
jgi:hypothetical protein